MKAISLKIEGNSSNLEDLKTISPNLLCVFFSPSYVKNDAALQDIARQYPDAITIGCTTAGEISDGTLSENSICATAMQFDKTPMMAASQSVQDSQDSCDAAEKLGMELKKDDLKAVLVLSPGLNINGSEVVKGLAKAVGPDVTIFGGLAGDGTDFKETHTFLNGNLSNKDLIAVGFYGDNIKIKTGSKGGWSPFGPARRVTKCNENILYELDNKPALDLYEEYLGDKAKDLPATGLLYPFAFLNEDHSQTGLIRTILDVNHEDKSLILAGNMIPNSLVCLMHADTDELIDGAEEAANDACISPVQDSAAILVSCVGRKIVLADDIEEEIEVVREVLGANTAMSGFYSYGEICPVLETNKVELHNQTMTIAHITES